MQSRLICDVSVERRVWALTQLEAWCDSPGKLCRAAHLELEGAFKLKMRKRKAHYLLFLPLSDTRGGRAGLGAAMGTEMDLTPRTLVAFKSQNFYRESRL